ncbi:pyridoxamine 5'-phosphate oxidase family protein [Thermomonospora cellulosilytica]|uniref:Nitroimidazol reductase NimA-like FMN-containing flavoprotein (Pyridoxamine 5'-phosphate oxidase superfamily) n=1 Tax=Thermomonospora cellulosilytica TaxID=1411118 RepID=A0A7W3MVR2_9ACTN|nr:pyridoxamine 5'-phosphate oxidase family protein [Thermomonospora cellulosilytica]MBA9002763.1 nitroimidazol reductase NimA-like FMN-containing flavoprotein (pyridoxamine 5'-phosphate oxidase superfamily) [Thermomonospora cellulosilytica]
MSTDGNRLQALERRECLDLMGTVPIGRVVFTDHALPAVRPVAFVLDGEDVVIRTAPGSELATALRGAVVAFETDDFDPAFATGWSVTVVGQARVVRDPGELRRLAELPLQPWPPGPHPHYIRISTQRISGRRLRPAAAGTGTAAGRCPR